MNQSLVSVIVPTFNRAYCLGRALDSALHQTHRNVEIIVVDDGSVDNTEALIQEKYGNEPRVRYFKQPNRGVIKARNLGFTKIHGDFVALLDSDDVWKPWKLAAQLDCMNRFPQIGMVWTDMQAINSEGEILYETYLSRMYSCWRRYSKREIFDQRHPLTGLPGNLYIGEIYSEMFMGSLVHTSTVLMRRDRFEKVKEFDEALAPVGEDYDFHARTCREGPVGFIDLPSIQYQIGMSDCLTEHKYEVPMALNALKTVEAHYRQNRSHIKLPAKTIRERFAQLHAWAGEALVDVGRRSEARVHLMKSLRYHPLQPRTVRLLALASAPPNLGNWMRSIYRSSKAVPKSAA